ncbi:hypothetical protein ACHHYP_20586 [Achlya hypogyna]|uniref:Uncharacterized protein n=1 Tax=Achlya hypogyna TaxID=1202772 RepID=A0A1V9YI22_ACHHY|nr:hypothetical protein ACHHYP_20586 [Achlya hypogyna]
MAVEGSGSSIFDIFLAALYVGVAIVALLILVGIYFCYKNSRADAELDELQGYHEVEDPTEPIPRDTVCSRGDGIRCDKVETKVSLQGIAKPRASVTHKSYAAVAQESPTTTL